MGRVRSGAAPRIVMKETRGAAAACCRPMGAGSGAAASYRVTGEARGAGGFCRIMTELCELIGEARGAAACSRPMGERSPLRSLRNGSAAFHACKRGLLDWHMRNWVRICTRDKLNINDPHVNGSETQRTWGHRRAHKCTHMRGPSRQAHVYSMCMLMSCIVW